MLWEPSAFIHDPYAYLCNQAGHAYLVGTPLALLALSFGGIWTPLIVAAVYWLVWELGVQRGRMWRDSIEDTVHVMTGAGVICAALEGGYWPVWALLLAQAVLLAVGVWRRWRDFLLSMSGDRLD